MKNLLWLCVGVTLFAGCEKTIEEPAFSIVPYIILEGVSSDTIIQFQENIRLTISYEDGDGDLGTSDPDVNQIFIKDARLEAADEYYLPPLSPEDASISIQGSFEVQLSPTFLLGNGTQETTIFTIYVVDQAGNKSNVIETDPILILKE